jgi:hypothetical protein
MKKLTVMCDYCADGLWDDEGRATHWSMLKEDYNFELPENLINKLEDWQAQYEKFNFFESAEITDKELSTPEFKEFEKLGKEIALEISLLAPDDVQVIYFNERDNKRYLINNKNFIEKDSQ